MSHERQGVQRERFQNAVLSSVMDVFSRVGSDGQGTLTKMELHEALSQESIKSRLKLIDIKPADLKLLFELLDDDGSGEVPVRQFSRSCQRLRGDALARDLNHLSIDLDRYTHWIDEGEEKIMGMNDQISDLLDTMDKIDLDVVLDPGEDEKDPVMVIRRQREFRSRSEILRTRRKSMDGCDAGVRFNPSLNRGMNRGSAAATKDTKPHTLQHRQRQQQLLQQQQQQKNKRQRPSVGFRPKPSTLRRLTTREHEQSFQAAHWPHLALPEPPPMPAHLLSSE